MSMEQLTGDEAQEAARKAWAEELLARLRNPEATGKEKRLALAALVARSSDSRPHTHHLVVNRVETSLQEVGAEPQQVEIITGLFRGGWARQNLRLFTLLGSTTPERPPVTADSREVFHDEVEEEFSRILFGLGPSEGPTDLLPDGRSGFGVFEDMSEG